jgi:hypothetical protein
MDKTEQKKNSKFKKLKNLITKKNTVIAVLIIGLIIQFLQVRNNTFELASLRNRESSLIGEVGQIKDTYLRVGNDLGEVRQLLRLPIQTYEQIQEAAPQEDNKNLDQVQLALFQYVDYISNTKTTQTKLNTNKSLIDNLLIAKDFTSFLAKEGLVLAPVLRSPENITVKIEDVQGNNIVTYYFDQGDGTLLFKTIDQKEEVTATDFATFKQDLMTFLTDNKADIIAKSQAIKNLRTKVTAAFDSTKIKTILTNRGLFVSPNILEKDLKITWQLFNRTNELAGEIILNTENQEISLVDSNNKNVNFTITDPMVSLPPYLEALDSRTILERNATVAITSFTNTLKDKGFNLLLSKSGWHFATQRSDTDRIYYDLLNEKNMLVSTFTIEKTTGVITITDTEGYKNENLLMFNPDLKKKP